MKIAVSSSGSDPDSEMDERLGRCPYFMILDTSTGKMEAIVNTAAESSSGAGTRAMQLLVDRGVEVIISGRIGPHASAMLGDSGMESVTGRSGKVGKVLEDFRRERGL
ncbi:MAG: dinitrogenase iron-molybdenum cofactor biosynthesis protein [Euryarchaeota archaeon]|nr:dinitrogenase iron-molybdenum cofactor biosynthesis protein [Euryarchaeota archaeon]